MALIDPAQAMGNVVTLARTDPRHLAGIGEALSAPVGGTAASGGAAEQKFADLLLGALGDVNASQLKAMDLSQRMVADPGSVNVEDVTIALADANLALSMTKAIVDRALAAYREIINIR
jgi:flagellar hook-basal body complex protein FliE